jgi:hypothetical protein
MVSVNRIAFRRVSWPYPATPFVIAGVVLFPRWICRWICAAVSIQRRDSFYTTLSIRSGRNQRCNLDPITVTEFRYPFSQLCVFFECPFTEICGLLVDGGVQMVAPPYGTLCIRSTRNQGTSAVPIVAELPHRFDKFWFTILHVGVQTKNRQIGPFVASFLSLLPYRSIDQSTSISISISAKYDGVVNHCFQCGESEEVHGVKGVLPYFTTLIIGSTQNHRSNCGPMFLYHVSKLCVFFRCSSTYVQEGVHMLDPSYMTLSIRSTQNHRSNCGPIFAAMRQ